MARRTTNHDEDDDGYDTGQDEIIAPSGTISDRGAFTNQSISTTLTESDRDHGVKFVNDEPEKSDKE